MKIRLMILFLFAELMVFPSFGIVSFGEKQDGDVSSDGFFQVEDKYYERQHLQTGETITAEGTFTAIIIEGLGAILIVLFIIIYAIKKKRRKGSE